jgi:hypothetical protein
MSFLSRQEKPGLTTPVQKEQASRMRPSKREINTTL